MKQFLTDLFHRMADLVPRSLITVSSFVRYFSSGLVGTWCMEEKAQSCGVTPRACTRGSPRMCAVSVMLELSVSIIIFKIYYLW